MAPVARDRIARTCRL